ncbi:hypothetical protein COCSUDRAFT_41924 [Coccomyxa subellipsoidea C-169]|uniref:Uncharacterized protein n=1 Tax=Coccomyxa subellipsoidea (strain C-169) TaxID=574566 RepID=I0YZG2_COCSC|nr:hypothetical protein COCSUDRAFT_41924 [Coccomyxa subellipsoidea C-169]EIE23781.1 hypothetical protein COCSUDRAFT_41924 [Coccomyxa subellipsoidea C-169]|eukprot:XP_005648325.1 hypothetical protein COCSUDRAFT_41924 [Coccomyxa subellipsoidea C-169]
MACLKMLVALPTPLGGEVASLIRERDPNHAILKNAPKRMDGDPSARIATEEAKQSAAQRDTSMEIDDPSSSRNSPAEGDAPSSAPAGDIPMWEFEPVMDLAPTDAASGEQPHTSRRRRRRSHGRSGQESSPQGEEALKDYFDSRWDEPRAPVQ